MINNFGTQHRQTKSYKGHLNVVEPEKVHIGSTYSAPTHVSRNALTEKSHFGYFIPMKQSLSFLLETLPSPFFKKSKVNCVLKNDVFDGLIIKNQIKTDNTLALTVYSDDAEPVNAVGAHTKKKIIN